MSPSWEEALPPEKWEKEGGKKGCNKTGNLGVCQPRPPSSSPSRLVTKYFPNILCWPSWVPSCPPHPSPFWAENKGQKEEGEE